MTITPPFVEQSSEGLFVIDTGFQRPRFDAAYLLVSGGRAAFVDTGTNHAVPRLLEALAAQGLERDAVDFVIATHVHLDHAGGAGLLMSHLPAARLVVHPRGARHLIDPRLLYRSALAVYGQDEMDRSYGEVRGVPAARVLSTYDGFELAVGGRSLRFIHTPGHARHHHCIWDEASRGWFTGDTFGLSYREFDSPTGAWALPTSTPTQFDPQALKFSIGRLLEAKPRVMYLTHFGPVSDVDRLAAELFEQIDAMVEVAQRLRAHSPHQRQALLKRELAALYAQRIERHGVHADESRMGLLAMDIELNAQGLGIWLDRSVFPPSQ